MIENLWKNVFSFYTENSRLKSTTRVKSEYKTKQRIYLSLIVKHNNNSHDD